MNLLDENFPRDQRQFLRDWRVRVRHFGYEIGERGTDDEGIIPFLHQLKNTTWFTLDQGFYRPSLRHSNYCIVVLPPHEEEAASFVRRFLRQPDLNTVRKRMGAVIRVSRARIRRWRLGIDAEESLEWTSGRPARQRSPRSR